MKRFKNFLLLLLTVGVACAVILLVIFNFFATPQIKQFLAQIEQPKQTPSTITDGTSHTPNSYKDNLSGISFQYPSTWKSVGLKPFIKLPTNFATPIIGLSPEKFPSNFLPLMYLISWPNPSRLSISDYQLQHKQDGFGTCVLLDKCSQMFFIPADRAFIGIYVLQTTSKTYITDQKKVLDMIHSSFKL